jgi:hypothetical protein
LEFIVQNSEGFGSWAKRNLPHLNLPTTMHVWEFLDLRKMVFYIFEVGLFEVNWEVLIFKLLCIVDQLAQ